MNKSYGIHDKWTDLDKVNDVRVESIDGVIENITINGEPAGGGGPFSNVKVTINGEYQILDFGGIYSGESDALACALIKVDNKIYSYYSFNEDTSFPTELNILFNEAIAEGVIPQLSIETSTPKTISVSGDATIFDQSETWAMIYFTGNCTINIA